jgi:hypothetical protein
VLFHGLTICHLSSKFLSHFRNIQMRGEERAIQDVFNVLKQGIEETAAPVI